MAGKQEPEWESVAEAAPTMVAFDTFGDVFVGVYTARETITDPNNSDPDKNHWELYHFTGMFPDELAGEHCGINGSYAIDKAMENIAFGNLVRFEYVKDVPTRKGNPLKSFDVKTRPNTKVTSS